MSLNPAVLEFFFAYMLVFVRLSAAMMLLPGFGESYVPARLKILMVMLMTLLIAPVVQAGIPSNPATAAEMVLLITGEVVIGLFFGTVARLITAVLEVAGMFISFEMSLSNATMFNPMMATQGSIVSVFLSVAGVLLIFVTDLHHVFLMGLTDTYTLFVPGQVPPIEGLAEYITGIADQIFAIAFKISAPLIVVGILFSFALGLIGRLMPQLQVFFVAMPLKITLGLLIIMISVTGSMVIFLEYVEGTMDAFLKQGI
jgi:flagellar biosynthetic protein FliR